MKFQRSRSFRCRGTGISLGQTFGTRNQLGISARIVTMHRAVSRRDATIPWILVTVPDIDSVHRGSNRDNYAVGINVIIIHNLSDSDCDKKRWMPDTITLQKNVLNTKGSHVRNVELKAITCYLRKICFSYVRITKLHLGVACSSLYSQFAYIANMFVYI